MLRKAVKRLLAPAVAALVTTGAWANEPVESGAMAADAACPDQACAPVDLEGPVASVACSCSCDLLTRSQLTGDWGGHRTCLAESGITVDADVTQFYYGVTSGGLDNEFRYGGHADYVVNTDFGKLGLQEGLFLKLRAEHRFGEAIGTATGALLPANISASLPRPDTYDVYLTDFLFTQAFSENFAVFAGKMNTLDGDMNAFAHGRGKEQFSNLALTNNPLLLRTVPYSSLGAGFVILNEMQPIFTFTVINPTDTVNSAGFDSLFNDGVSLVAESRVPVNLFGLPGHQVLGGTWSNKDYIALGQDPRIILPSVPIERTEGSWSVYWNCDQYLQTYCDDPTKGWGVFGRASIGDDDANPIAYFLSAGIGGNSPLRCRRADTFGVGYYYSATSEEIGPILQALFGPVGDGQGVELYYNIAATPWLNITPDLQIIDPARENVQTAVVAGIRAKIEF